MSPKGAAPNNIDDLGQRFLSAIVLIPLALGATVAGGPWLAGAAGAAIVAMTYEWARMSEPGAVNLAWALGLTGALGGVMLASHGNFTWALEWVAAWALISGARRGVSAGLIETAAGVLYVGGPCVAFLWLRADPDHGFQTIIALFVIVWSVDIAAYFAGRLIGGAPLWRAVSPHKTYTGAVAGLAAGTAAGLGCALAFGGSASIWAIAALILALCALAGDLLESAIKRRFGVKDASRLIPGHGGVLDRLDGLIAATTAAAVALVAAPGVYGALWGGAS